MNRSIKFRAWNPQGNMLAPFEMGDGTTNEALLFQEKWPIMQFTGLLDKNGKEIYENDICIHQQVAGGIFSSAPAKNVKIVWTELHNGWICDDGMYQYSMQSSQLEIIGNVFEHSHLLTERK